MDTAIASTARPRTVHHPLPSGPQAAGEARRSAARTLALHPVRCPQETACDILLIASELVTNAVRHALPPYALTISLDRGRAGICVSDGSLSLPRRGDRRGTDTTRGRGLQIVLALGADLFVSRSPHGKQVIAVITWQDG
ncbi:anti-sigma regulatory factor (Ser/Thr protein kinase) [Streptomyces sp. CG 926]|uniref:ATP-binding protein n=1 Tax=Streptomyces sp. CG 926 TaxID=1882405 RepID=UPI000D6D4F5A|nr:ATP-binding protein [Streptomyces sp. CG 926]PWK74347.1 anti-sigma regulatory factor (Ser/Thr protein kinase) [Streptomyces sp. CG 926]